MNEKYSLTKFTAGDTKEHEGVTYKAVRQEQDEMRKGGVRSIRGANPAKALGGGCV